MKALNTSEIDAILKKHLPPHVKWMGVTAANQWPNNPPQNKASAFVSNEQCICRKGNHWICVFTDSVGRGHYFDSYAKPIPHTAWKAWFKKHTRSLHISKRVIQRPNTNFCGYFCIFFLMHKSFRPHVPNDVIMHNVDGKKAYLYVQNLMNKKSL